MRHDKLERELYLPCLLTKEYPCAWQYITTLPNGLHRFSVPLCSYAAIIGRLRSDFMITSRKRRWWRFTKYIKEKINRMANT